MGHRTDSHTADGKRGEDFMFAMQDDVRMANYNLAGEGEAPWVTVANYVANLERRVCELEEKLSSMGGNGW